MRSEEPRVIVEEKLRGVLKSGEVGLLVLCNKQLTRQGSYWRGDWRVHTIDSDGERKVLMTYRYTPRIFKTLIGITSWLIDLGLPHLMVPHREGEAYELWMDGKYCLYEKNGKVSSRGKFE